MCVEKFSVLMKIYLLILEACVEVQEAPTNYFPSEGLSMPSV
jgi:hypothetical protein